MPYYRKSKGKQYLYFLTERPVDFGTTPNGGFIDFENYRTRRPVSVYNQDTKQYICCKAWAYIYYKRKLTQDEINNYELVYGGCEDD